MGNGSEQDTAIWPIPKFYFSVKIGDSVIPFKEVSGLTSETQVIEYRHGDSKEFSNIKMPGLKKFANVTLKKGVLKSDNKLWDWFALIKMNTIERKTVIISLLDEGGNATMSWNLNNAFPVKISSTDMKSDGNEVAIDSLEIAFETMEITNA